MMINRQNQSSLFSEIGGFDLGLTRAGWRCVGQIEIDPYYRTVLHHHWPEIKKAQDIRIVDEFEFEKPLLVCGGFPCQPFSCAGNQRGTLDDRYLWPHMHRIIANLRPDWVLGENVPGIIRLALDTVLSDLESQGYSCRTFVIPACAVDAPHRRDRVWIVAHTSGKRIQGMRKTGQLEPEDMASKKLPDRCREACRTARWAPEPTVGRLVDGIPDRVAQLRSLGNAVVPQVVEAIGRMIIRAEMMCEILANFDFPAELGDALTTEHDNGR